MLRFPSGPPDKMAAVSGCSRQIIPEAAPGSPWLRGRFTFQAQTPSDGRDWILVPRTMSPSQTLTCLHKARRARIALP
jgi:hypothetical protein